MKTKFRVRIEVLRGDCASIDDIVVNAQSEFTLKRHLGYRYQDAKYDILNIERVEDMQMSLF